MSIQEINPGDLSPLQRQMNRTLMVTWINRDLIERCACDVRTSTVLYDADKMFLFAANVELDDELKERLATQSPVRFFSKGV